MQLDAAQTEPLKVEFVDIANKEWLFLGEAIEWIMSRGRIVPEERYDKWWRAAKRVLFRRLDANRGGRKQASVQGYRAESGTQEYKKLPRGIWAKMKGISMPGSQFDPSRNPLFSPVDDGEECDNGGTIWRRKKKKEEKWEGVRLRTKFVLKHWPLKAAANGSAAGTPPQRGDPRELVERGKAWLKEQVRRWEEGKGPQLSCRQVEKAMRQIYGLKQPRGREVWDDTDLPPEWRKPGPRPKRKGIA